MARVLTFSEALREVTDVDGVIGAALIDGESGMSYGESYGRAAGERVGGAKAGGGPDMFAAARANVPVMRACLHTCTSGVLGTRGSLEDVVVTLGRQHHVMRVVCGLSQALYLYVILDRRRGANLSLLRMHLDGVVARMAG